jgi:regulator of sigma E protease
MILSIAAVLFTFGLVIFLHEFGHFLVCKLAKIKVEAFSFGFGPELFGRVKGDTRYSIRAIPLGGYVKPAGENIEDATGHPDEYFSKPWHTRLGVVLAGPFMNYLLAFVLFTGLIYTVGRPVYSSVIGDVAAGLPAEGAGLKPGDRIVSVDGVKVSAWDDMAELIHKKVDGEVLIGYERKGAAAAMKIKTKRGLDQETGKDVGLIGIAPDQAASVFKKVGALDSLRFGAGQCWFWTAYTVKTLASNIRRREKPDISGPIGIVNIVSKAAHTGMPDLFFLIALISVAVGFFNLLPIPLLDGGHAVIFISEGIFRRKITPRVMGWLNSMGIAFVACIFIFATYSDIKRLIAPKAAPARIAQPAQKK